MTERIVSIFAFFFIEWDAILALKRWTNRNFNFRPSSCLEQWLLLVKLAHFPNISQKVLHPGAISRFLVQWSSLGLQQGCAEHPPCTTGSWAVPCSTSHLCQRAPATAQVWGLTGFSLWFNTLTAVDRSSRKSLPFLELFPMFLPPQEVLWNFPGCAGVSCGSQALLGKLSDLTEKEDRIME